MFLDDILKAALYWKSNFEASARSTPSLQSAAELYELLRDLQASQRMNILRPDDIRSALSCLGRSRSPLVNVATGGYAQRLFLDLQLLWKSPWRSTDYLALFDVLRREGLFEDSLSIMRLIHEVRGLNVYPGGDSWALLLEATGGIQDIVVLRKCQEAWSLMHYYGTQPTTATFNALFGVLYHIPDAFNFIMTVYQQQFLPSRSSPDYSTLRYLLEAQMKQSPSEDIIADGNLIFDQLMDFKASRVYGPLFWSTIVKWMLFRGDPLNLIKHALHEQNAKLGRITQKQAFPDTTSMSRRISDDQTSAAIVATLDQLIGLALQIGNLKVAQIISEEFFPALDVSHTVKTDEMNLDLLIRIGDAEAAKSLYDTLRSQHHPIPAKISLQLLQCIANSEKSLPIDAQVLFFDILDRRDSPPETYCASFAILMKLLLRAADYPRMRQTLQDRCIELVPNWQNILSNICLDVLSDSENIWLESMLPVYHIVQRYAPNTISLSQRHAFMQKLVSHGRTDLGLELFHDMRHSDVSQPSRETYAIMLSGCARTRDAQTLEHIHNALRLDSSIEPDSALFNSLMLAYNRCRLPEKALAIWEVLSESSRLPDAETASLALDACVRLPRYGLVRAREIWTFMEKNHMEPLSSSYAALLAVFASVGKWDGMMGLLERMDRNKVSATVLGTAYNCMRRDRKVEVEAWARANKPDVWEYLEQLK